MCRLTHNTYTIHVQYHSLSMCQGLMIQTILHYTPRKGVCQWGEISGTKHSRGFGCMLVMTLFIFWQVRKQVWMVLVYYSLQHFWGDPTYQSQGQRVQVLVNEGQSTRVFEYIHCVQTVATSYHSGLFLGETSYNIFSNVTSQNKIQLYSSSKGIYVILIHYLNRK